MKRFTAFRKFIFTSLLMLVPLATGLFTCALIPTAPPLGIDATLEVVPLKLHRIAIRITGITESAFSSVNIYHDTIQRASIKNNTNVPYIESAVSDTINDTIENLLEKRPYHFIVVARNKDNIPSENILIASTTTLDETAPEPVTELNATTDSSSADFRRAMVSWKPQYTADVEFVEICWNQNTYGPGNCIKINPADSNFLLNGLMPESDYIVTVSTVDSSGNPTDSSLASTIALPRYQKRPLPVRDLSCSFSIGKDTLFIQWNSSVNPIILSHAINIDTTGNCSDRVDLNSAIIIPDSMKRVSLPLPRLLNGTNLCASIFSKDCYDNLSEPAKIKVSVLIDTTIDTIVKIDTLYNNDTVYLHDTLITHDTLIIRDTLYISKHDTVIVTVHDTIHDTSTFFVHDTTTVHDTIRISVELPATGPEAVRNFFCRYNRSDDSLRLYWQPSASPGADSVGFNWQLNGPCPEKYTPGFSNLVANGAESTIVAIPHLNPGNRFCISAFVKNSSNLWSGPTTASLSVFVETRIDTIYKTDTMKVMVHDTLFVNDTLVVLRTDTITIIDYDTTFITVHNTDTVNVHDTTTVTKYDTITLNNTDTLLVNLRDTIPPVNVSGLTAIPYGDSAVIIVWIASISTDAKTMLVSFRNDGTCCSGATDPIGIHRLKSKFAVSDTIQGLKQKTNYCFSVSIQDSSGNWNRNSDSIYARITLPDRTKPQNVSALSAVLDGTSCNLSWEGSVSADADSLVVRYRTDGNYPANESDGTLLHRWSSTVEFDTLRNIDAVSNYWFTVFVKDSSNCWSLPTKGSRCILNRPPTANAGMDVTLSYIGSNTIQLDGRGSRDPEGSQLLYKWTGAKNNPAQISIASIQRPMINLSIPGTYVFILTVSDGILNSEPDQCMVTFVVPQIIVSRTLPPGNGYIICRTVQEGIDSAKSGDTVFITTDTYQENVDIYKNGLCIYSADSNTIIDGRNLGSSITFLGSRNNVLKNLKIIHGGRTDAEEIDVGGVVCSSATNISIESCVLSGNNGDGIRLWVSSGITIKNCKIISNDWNGIRVTSSSFSVTNNKFEYNNTRDNTASTANISLEMRLGEATKYSVDVAANTFRSIQGGHHIGIYGPYIVNITGNHLQSDIGVNPIGEAIAATPGSRCRIILANNKFINNTIVTSILCSGAEKITSTSDSIICTNHGIDTKGYDIVSSCQGAEGVGSEINSCYLQGFVKGLSVYNSPLNIILNTFQTCPTGIIVTGSRSYLPVFSNNNYPGCVIEVDTAGVY